MKGETALVRFLLGKGADVEAKCPPWSSPVETWYTPLQIAVQEGCVEVVEILLAADADFRILNYFGESLIHLAAWGRHFLAQPRVDQRRLKVMKLLEGKIDVRTQCHRGRTALDVAAHRRKYSTLKYLLGQVDFTRIQDCRRRNALHCAVDGGHKDVIISMVAAGFDVSIRDESGASMLHETIGNWRWRFEDKEKAIETSLLLVWLGANPMAVNDRGYNALDMAFS